MKQRGRLIVFEGCDGSGKSTAVTFLKQKLIEQGRVIPEIVNILKDDPVAAQIRTIVTGLGNEIHPDAEAGLYAAAVTNTYRLRIVPLLERGIDVICDRSHISTLAYQAAPAAIEGNNRPMDIWQAAYEGFGGIHPDVLVILYTDSITGLERVVERDGVLDRIEQRGAAFQAQVQEAYRNYCETVSTRQPIFQYTNNTTLKDLEDFIDSVVETVVSIDITG